MPTEIQVVSNSPPLPGRPADGHKGLFGRVLVVGGDVGMLGAPVLAGTAALRMGAGLVQIAVPAAILSHALSITPELIGIPLKRSAGAAIQRAVASADAIVLGPGMGTGAFSQSLVLRLLRCDKPMVLDADALNTLSRQPRWPAGIKASAVLTPHPGEMSRMLPLFPKAFLRAHALKPGAPLPADDDARILIAAEAARITRQVVLLKGHRTVVTDGRRGYLNTTGDSTLSKAGAGDVLSGIIGCLLAQGIEPFDAACIGARLHGRAGEIAGQRFTRRCALARDVIDAIPAACSE